MEQFIHIILKHAVIYHLKKPNLRGSNLELFCQFVQVPRQVNHGDLVEIMRIC